MTSSMTNTITNANLGGIVRRERMELCSREIEEHQK